MDMDQPDILGPIKQPQQLARDMDSQAGHGVATAAVGTIMREDSSEMAAHHLAAEVVRKTLWLDTRVALGCCLTITCHDHEKRSFPA